MVVKGTNWLTSVSVLMVALNAAGVGGSEGLLPDYALLPSGVLDRSQRKGAASGVRWSSPSLKLHLWQSINDQLPKLWRIRRSQKRLTLYGLTLSGGLPSQKPRPKGLGP